MRITEDHLRQWREHGYTVIENFIPPAMLHAIQSALLARFPTFEQYASAPGMYRSNAHGGHMKELPYLGDLLNFVAVDPEIVTFVEQALDTKKIALIQSIVWAKYPLIDNFEQALHVDYTNASLTFPQDEPEDVTFLIYYVDVDPQMGATCVVSKQDTRDNPMVPYRQPREEFPAIYAHERPLYVRAGSMLIYSGSTFHRASALTATDRTRFSHHFQYRAESVPWIGYMHWGTLGLNPEMIDFVERATPRQRELIGFPVLGHEYWTPKTLVGVAGRYPNIDMTPYIDHAELPEADREQVRKRIGDVRRPKPDEPKVLLEAYYKGAADYFSAMTGLPSEMWLAWLTAQ